MKGYDPRADIKKIVFDCCFRCKLHKRFAFWTSPVKCYKECLDKNLNMNHTTRECLSTNFPESGTCLVECMPWWGSPEACGDCSGLNACKDVYKRCVTLEDKISAKP